MTPATPVKTTVTVNLGSMNHGMLRRRALSPGMILLVDDAVDDSVAVVIDEDIVGPGRLTYTAGRWQLQVHSVRC